MGTNATEQPGHRLESAPSVLMGDRFLGNRCLHHQGEVQTWRGVDLSTGSSVVLKWAPLHILKPGVVERLSQDHSRLHEVRDSSLSPPLHWGVENNRFCQVTPYVPGETLAERLVHGPLPVEQSLQIGCSLLKALRGAHACGVFHRHLQPSNVILGGDGARREAVLTDFGLAPDDLLESSLQHLPLTAVQYLSPEQAGLVSADVGPASDLYAVGVLLFACLAGEPPFQGSTLGELLRQHLTASPELRARGVLVPRALEQAVQHFLSKDPWERYQSAAAALEDLEAIASQLARGTSEPAVVVGSSDRRRRLAEPAFIGRGQELKALEEALGETLQGKGGLTLVEGLSGQGKTMLLDELARLARSRGVWVLRGTGLALVAQSPLQVLSGVVQDLTAAMEGTPALATLLRDRLGEQSEALCEAIPQLAGSLGHTESVKLGPEELAEARTVRALVTLLDALGTAERPAIVLLDDLQWADELTLKALKAWWKRPADEPRREGFVSVVLSFRAEEVLAGHDLQGLEAAHRITVPPLEARDIRHLAQAMAGTLPEEALQTVVRLSSGNPFMASAVVRGLVESGALVPASSGWRVVPERLAETHSSRQATSFLLRRMELLPEETRRLLMRGAILGREFDVELAAALARLPVTQALAALEQARQRHLVWPQDQEGHHFSFAHDQLREALLEELSTETAQELHHDAALELERRAPHRSFEIAWHFEAAGALQRAWPHAREAARRARQQHALALAERYYRLADHGAVEADNATRLSILEELGKVLLSRVSVVEAEQCFERAQAFATSRLDIARLEGLRGQVAQAYMDLQTANHLYERALQLLGQRVPRNRLSQLLSVFWQLFMRVLRSARRGRRLQGAVSYEGKTQLAVDLLARLAQTYWYTSGSKLAALWAHLCVLNIAERYTPTPDLAAAYANHGAMFFILSHTVMRLPAFLRVPSAARGQRYFQEALAMRQAFGDVFAHGETLHVYHHCLFESARFTEVLQGSHEAEQLLRRAGDHWYLLAVLWIRAGAYYMRGDLSASIATSQAVLRSATEVDCTPNHVIALALEFWSLASHGNIPREVLASALERSAANPQMSPADRLSRAALLRAEGVRLLFAGDAQRAATTFSQAIRLHQESHVTVPMYNHSLATAYRQAAEQLPSYDCARRARLLRQAKAVAKQMLRGPNFAGAADPYALRELGLLAATNGRKARARRYFDRSLAIAERMSLRYERAQTLLARGQVGTALGWSDASTDLATGEAELQAMRSGLKPPSETQPHANLSLVDRFPRILEAGRTIASALTRDGVFEAVRSAAQGLLRGEEYVLVEVTREECKAPPTLGEALRPFLQRALETNRAVVPSTEELEGAGGAGVRSALFAPISMRGEGVALFGVTHRKVSDAFGPEEARIAEFIATLAGAALENAQGFAEVNALSQERERLYQQAQAALRKRDEFLAVASHELRTPFTPMRLYMQGLLNALRQPARAAGMEPWVAKLELANSRLQRLARLVEEMFDVSRMAYRKLPLKRSEVDLAALAAEAVDRWKEELARVKCECTLEAPGPVVGQWDGLRLEQVIDNLLSNAMRYGPGKPIHLTVKQDAATAWLLVKDQGMGIAREDQTRIFELFERAVSEENYGGFGMGLWISREVVQAHGGRISVESTPGQGATFRIELPLCPTA